MSSIGEQTRQMKIIDVTLGLSPRTPMWPGAARFHISQRKIALGDGKEATSSEFGMVPHCGTHVDSPLHFAKGGKTIDAVPLDLLIGPCSVLEYRGEGHIALADLLAMGFVPEKRILIKTRNSAKLREGVFDTEFPSLLPDALDHLIQSGVQLLGIDSFSIGPFGDLTTRNHLAFCGAGGIIIEVLDLTDVQPGKYELIAMPLKLEGAEGAPARVVLLEPQGTLS
jgi:arylformamidase